MGLRLAGIQKAVGPLGGNQVGLVPLISDQIEAVR